MVVRLFTLDTQSVLQTVLITAFRHCHSVRPVVLQTVIRPPSAGRQNFDEQPMEQPRNEGGLMSVSKTCIIWMFPRAECKEASFRQEVDLILVDLKPGWTRCHHCKDETIF